MLKGHQALKQEKNTKAFFDTLKVKDLKQEKTVRSSARRRNKRCLNSHL